MRIRRYVKLSAALLVIGLFAVLTLFSGALYTYSVLTDEALVAELHFSELGPEHFEARLVTDGGCTERSFDLYGDQWRLDARFLKWHGWANLLGFDAWYRLSRIEGRYADVSEQNSRRNLAYSLEAEPALDLVDIAAGMGRWNVFVDSTYGSSTFQDIDTESVHRVYRTQTGLIARSEALPAAPRSADAIVVEVQNACGRPPGIWQRFSTWVDRSLSRALGRHGAG
ncbi:MAG: hypothetical protein PVF50_03920 [Gammaproteobacteria bacterium]|jgi:hypothetical protein